MQTEWKHGSLLRIRVYALQSNRATDADNKWRAVSQNEGKELLDTWFGKYQKNCPGQVVAARTLWFLLFLAPSHCFLYLTLKIRIIPRFGENRFLKR